MFFSKTPPVISGGAALVRGQRFHLERVLYAYVQVIDALTGRFGRGRSALISHRTDLKGPFAWPDPAKEKALKVWRGLGAHYDALGEGVTHVIPALPMTAKAYVLGRTWTVYDAATRRHLTPQGKDAASADTTPLIEIYGRDLPGGGRSGLGLQTVEAVRSLIARDLARYGLVVVTFTVEDEGARPQTVVTVRFPREAYGAGEDWIRVRCVAPDGTELGPVGFAN